MNSFCQDVRFAFRMLRSRPGFTAVVVLTLGLGIGANTAIFSVVDGVLVQQLDLPEPKELVQVWDVNKLSADEYDGVAPADYLDWQRQSSSFEELAGYFTTGVNLWGAEEPERVVLGVASRTYFSILRSEPILGRSFTSEEEQWGNHQVALITHALWQRHYAGDPEVLGKPIVLNGTSFTIIGVLPESFRFTGSDSRDGYPDVWRPLAFADPWLERTGARWIHVIGRLKPEVGIERARSEMAAIAAGIEEKYPQTNAQRTVRVIPLREVIVGNSRPVLRLLFGAVALVLLISCVNVSNLLLARAQTRQVEFSTRIALGAGHGRLVRQLLTESIVMALLAGLIGVLLAYWGINAIIASFSDSIPRLPEAGLDGRVLLFAVIASLVTALLFGLAPALTGTRGQLSQHLKQGGRGGSDSADGRRLRNLLVVSEIAVAVPLLIGAGLVIQSFRALQATDAGFSPQNVLTMTVILPQTGYHDDAPKIAFVDQVTERLANISGVESVGVTSFLPLSDINASRDYYVEGRSKPQPGEVPQAGRRLVSPGYFQAMKIQLLRGALFTEQDRADQPGVVVINSTLARQAWPDESPIGKRLSLDEPEKGNWRTVVGIVGDIRHLGVEKEPPPELYHPFAQYPWFAMSLVIRTRTDPLSYVDAVRREVLEVDNKLPVFDVQTLEQRLYESLSKQRFSFVVLTLLATVGLLLATIGVYAVISYMVNERTRDIAIHMAMGAKKRDVFTLVIRRGMSLIAVGIAVGMILTVLLKATMSKVLYKVIYGIESSDPVTFAAVVVLLAVVAVLANVLPARRAMKLNPVVALKDE